jgi:formate/nitrite transporter FocA (FNT family)
MVPSAMLINVSVKGLYLYVAAWALFARRKAENSAHRLLFVSIIAGTLLVFAADILVWSQLKLASAIPRLTSTVFACLYSMLVVAGFLVDARSGRQRKGKVVAS